MKQLNMYPQLAKEYRKFNRKNPTAAETTLWKLLKGKQFNERNFVGNIALDPTL